MVSQFEIIVESDGTGRYLVEEGADDVLAPFGEKVATWRNSHVETWSSLSSAAQQAAVDSVPMLATEADLQQFANLWWADMCPVGGPVLGPFDTRADALMAERQWLMANELPYPQ
jgi:hypothetical protein